MKKKNSIISKIILLLAAQFTWPAIWVSSLKEDCKLETDDSKKVEGTFMRIFLFMFFVNCAVIVLAAMKLYDIIQAHFLPLIF